MVKVQVSDINDNRPIFYPRQYKVSLPESELTTAGALVAVAATDADAGDNGRIQYSIASGNANGLFRIDPSTGEVGTYALESGERYGMGRWRGASRQGSRVRGVERGAWG